MRKRTRRKWKMEMRKRKMRKRAMKMRKRAMKMRKRRKRKTLTFRLGLPWGHHSSPDPPG